MNDHNPIQLLMDEHDIISSSKEIIQNNENLWEKDAEKYENAVRMLIAFFREYSDKFHHHKEEEVLFPAMTGHPEFLQHEIIAELEQHHSMFRDYVKEIKEALDGQKWENAQRKLKHYISDLLDHIAAENNEVFIMAQTLFSEDELEGLYFRFKDIDRKLGESRKQKLVKMLNQLKIIE